MVRCLCTARSSLVAGVRGPGFGHFLTRFGHRQEIIRHTAAAHGCEAELYFTSFDEDCLKTTGLPAAFASGCTYPPVLNDQDMYLLAKGAAQHLVRVPRCKGPKP